MMLSRHLRVWESKAARESSIVAVWRMSPGLVRRCGSEQHHAASIAWRLLVEFVSCMQQRRQFNQ